jgi:hypothetical protein
MNDLMFAGMAGMIAVWLAIQVVPAGVASVEAGLALLCLSSFAMVAIGAGGVMR